LLSVYLDATFFPRLQKLGTSTLLFKISSFLLDFMQEGHRFEFQSPEDANSPLEYKGVVFNEMKGALVRIMCVPFGLIVLL
jgi:Zn-dependent M16 (insulinase) family peptidase